MNFEYKVLHLFSGIGGFALGFQQAQEEYRGVQGSFKTLGGIDCDPEACIDFEKLTGAPAFCMDLFERRDYIAFHGKEPGADWHEVMPEDLRKVTKGKYPDIICTSPPCKGFSGLLPEKSAASEKYQALNRLTVRGLFLALEAFKDNLPAIILLENVPRIATRGQKLLHTIEGMLRSYGYIVSRANHDCGEIGGLGQHRKRFLLIARNPQKMLSFVYQPPKQRVKSIGEIIGPLPLPDDLSMGPMHRLPRLEWKTWIRLALIPAGGDWRDLEKIAPEQYRLEYVPRGRGPFGVQEWDRPAGTVIGNASVKGSTAAAVADPRVPARENRRSNGFIVRNWNDSAFTITGEDTIGSGAQSISDPRIGHTPREGVYRVQPWDKASTTVTGKATVNTSNGASCIADPRLKPSENRHPGVYQIIKYNESAPCVTGTRFGSGALAISDPRMKLSKNAHLNILKVTDFDQASNTVTGATRPASGSISVSDPRLGCQLRSGSYGVQDFDKPANTVIGSADVHAGTAAIADPRIPEDNDRPDPPPVIISLDGTWHRPLTTLELAALQDLPITFPDGSPLVLAGKSDSRWRERIGNAVPRAAAKAMAQTILRALLLNHFNDWELSSTAIWVQPNNISNTMEVSL
jgi:site-specific DNA-cytosine methylase